MPRDSQDLKVADLEKKYGCHYVLAVATTSDGGFGDMTRYATLTVEKRLGKPIKPTEYKSLKEAHEAGKEKVGREIDHGTVVEGIEGYDDIYRRFCIDEDFTDENERVNVKGKPLSYRQLFYGVLCSKPGRFDDSGGAFRAVRAEVVGVTLRLEREGYHFVNEVRDERTGQVFYLDCYRFGLNQSSGENSVIIDGPYGRVVLSPDPKWAMTALQEYMPDLKNAFERANERLHSAQAALNELMGLSTGPS